MSSRSWSRIERALTAFLGVAVDLVAGGYGWDRLVAIELEELFDIVLRGVLLLDGFCREAAFVGARAK